MNRYWAIAVLALSSFTPSITLSADDGVGNSAEKTAFEVFVNYRSAIVDPARVPHEYFSRAFLDYFLGMILERAGHSESLSRQVSLFAANVRIGRRIEVVHDYSETVMEDGSTVLAIAFSGSTVVSPAICEFRMILEQNRWRIDNVALDATPAAVSERGLSSSNVLLRFD